MRAMSWLTAEDLRRFRDHLLAAKASAEHVLELGSGAEPVEASGQTIGRLTRMDALQLRAMADLSRDQVRIRLRQIDAALLVMDGGRYGICRRCGRPMARERLEAMPEAPFCAPCQESFEG